MSKPYTETDFSAQITQDRSWRLREISDLKTAVIRADPQLRRVLLRSLITICYAHWEGYIRFAARKYLMFVALRKYQYKELNRQFLRNYFLPRLAALATQGSSVVERCALVDEILAAPDRRFSRINESLVDTKSNLNSKVFTDICLVCDIPTQFFESKADFIDVFLLKRRNAIAHGEDTFVAMEDLDELTGETISIMRAFGDELENRIYLKAYRMAQAV